MSSGPGLNQLNIVVRDMGRTVDFYRRLGLTIDAEPGAQHVAVALPSGFLLEFDSTDFVGQWDSGWRGSTGGNAVIGFGVGGGYDVYARLLGRFMSKYPVQSQDSSAEHDGCGELAGGELPLFRGSNGRVGHRDILEDVAARAVVGAGTVRRQKLYLARQRVSGCYRLLHLVHVAD